MAEKFVDLFYIGNSQNFISSGSPATLADAAQTILGTWGSASEPLFKQGEETGLAAEHPNLWGLDRVVDADDNAVITSGTADTINGELLIGMAGYDVTVTYTNGQTAQSQLSIIQDAKGNLFAVQGGGTYGDGAISGALETNPIVSITLDSVRFNNSGGNLMANIFGVDIAVCFLKGTFISTPNGEKKVEDLRAGDLILTTGNGAQPIRWIGCQNINLNSKDHLRPIRISTDALAVGVPERDLYLSPQHRVLVRSNISTQMFGASEVLAPAKSLIGLPGVEVDYSHDTADYFHILLDQHDIVRSNGAETETLFTGPQALKAVGQAARDEIFEIFPELADPDFMPLPARPFVSVQQAKKLVSRHEQRSRAIVN